MLKVSNARVLCSLMSSDDKWIVTGSSDSTARVINVETGVVRRAFRDHTGPVVGVQLSSDNELLVTGNDQMIGRLQTLNFRFRRFRRDGVGHKRRRDCGQNGRLNGSGDLSCDNEVTSHGVITARLRAQRAVCLPLMI